MEKNLAFSLNGKWIVDYISEKPYEGETEPVFDRSIYNADCITVGEVPGYFEDQLDRYRGTALHAKLAWNPMYTLQRYPHSGYSPDMALPYPVGCFMYQRTFTLAESDICGEEALYVGGVQNTLTLWINGKYVGRHEGYSVEFFIDIPKGLLQVGENRITLTVSNNRLAGYMGRPVSGLTSRAANECTGGIWGDVEIRSYPDGLRDAWVSVKEDLSSFTVKIAGGADVPKTVVIFDGKNEIFRGEIPAGESELTVPCEDYERWSPDAPKLYTARVTTKHQSLTARFGIRRLTVEGTRLFLNGKPYFFKGTCEHCYHPITVHPTREKAYYKKVLRTLKELGFNSIRFHTYVPMPEYMEAADELGMVLEVETPNNTTYAEWLEIVNKCRHYTSVCAYSSGNEMVIDEDYIEHLRAVAGYVHTESDALFSPMSAMRGIEYHSYGDYKVDTPFEHNPKRLAALSEFCDLYNSFSLCLTSYTSCEGTHEVLDERNAIYKKPILTHEICIHGTYIDLSLKDRYRGTVIGDTEFMSSVEKHLADRGLLDKAPLYYQNSVKWQKMLRKHCFELVRRCETFAGYDFLGDIDTHWHTFGYCVGMMNEFYELKPGETVENVLRYNGDRVLLCDLPRNPSYTAGEKVSLPILISNYGEPMAEAEITFRVKGDGKAIVRGTCRPENIPAGEITSLCRVDFTVPEICKPMKLTLTVMLTSGDTDIENEWEIYAFPKAKALPTADEIKAAGLTVAKDMSVDELVEKMRAGERVLLLSAGPFRSEETNFQIALAGRTAGHLATVIADHPLMEDFPHDGYCAFQFREMLNSRAAMLDVTRMPHDPIIDIASSYKNAHREALLFEYQIGAGKLLVCTLNLKEDDIPAAWLYERMLSYAMSDEFAPKDTLSFAELYALCEGAETVETVNSNLAMNRNDITMN